MKPQYIVLLSLNMGAAAFISYIFLNITFYGNIKFIEPNSLILTGELLTYLFVFVFDLYWFGKEAYKYRKELG